MGNGIHKDDHWSLEEIQRELRKIDDLPIAQKSDRQLATYDRLSLEYSERYKTMSNEEKVRHYSIGKRKTKLTQEQVAEIRQKYQRYINGKLRLGKLYGVSASVIHRIVMGKAWKK